MALPVDGVARSEKKNRQNEGGRKLPFTIHHFFCFSREKDDSNHSENLKNGMLNVELSKVMLFLKIKNYLKSVCF